MKKIISIMLVLVMLLTFVACNEDKEVPSTPQETVSLNAETLKADWQNGELFLPNGKTVKLPCKVSEFIEQSGLKIGNQDVLANKVLAPEESITLNVSGEGVNFKIKARNTTREEIGCMDATVIQYNFNNTNTANRQIKFASTLSPGVTRAAVEEALGVPKGQKSEDTLYYYKGKNSDKRNVKLIVSFNSDDIVNSVSYEIIYD